MFDYALNILHFKVDLSFMKKLCPEYYNGELRPKIFDKIEG
jgi:hypothetical protein